MAGDLGGGEKTRLGLASDMIDPIRSPFFCRPCNAEMAFFLAQIARSRARQGSAAFLFFSAGGHLV